MLHTSLLLRRTLRRPLAVWSAGRAVARLGAARRGFVLAYVLVAIGVISAVVAAVAASNRFATGSDAQSKTRPERNALLASQAIKVASYLRDAAIIHGSVNGYAGMSKASLIAAQIGVTADQFEFAADAAPSGLSVNVDIGQYDLSAVSGYTATNQSVLVTNLTAQVCRMINYNLYSIYDIPLSGGRSTAPEGCISGTYFKATLPGN